MESAPALSTETEPQAALVETKRKEDVQTEQDAFFAQLTPAERAFWQNYKYAKNEFHQRQGTYRHALFRLFPGSFQELCTWEWSFEQIHSPWFQVWEQNSDHHMNECYYRYCTAQSKMCKLSQEAQVTIQKRCIRSTLEVDPATEENGLIDKIEGWLKDVSH